MCLDLQGTIASEEEDLPVAVEETYSGNYVVVFDPLDGCDARQSSIAQPALEKRCCTATILEGRICELTHCCWQQHAFSSVPPPQKGRRRKVHAFGPAGHPVLPRFETVIAQRSSSNIDAAISTGSIFGIYDPNDACSLEDMDDPTKMVENCVLNVCQPGGRPTHAYSHYIASILKCSRSLIHILRL